MFMRIVRWSAFAPTALLAGALVLQLGYVLAKFFGGGSWYLWLPCGAFAGQAFFWVAFRVAPAVTPAVKWVSVGLAGITASAAAVGSFISTEQPNMTVAYIAMVAIVIYYARRQTSELARDVLGTVV